MLNRDIKRAVVNTVMGSSIKWGNSLLLRKHQLLKALLHDVR